ncbi:ABC transporter permease [Pseudofrankia inefficax]|uniref:Binding-protein-dependent transport systems inner membrane component n=1 Tax=Pseudofrankia inefficax (strain DSM 45817 / CECT 9037 / DDB 130130 / EuI1c) TaxID=298654 RepID=E3J1Q8_PSEI1|nr:ABC transporter permease [Pseudofrankia inefficax]ADP82866.1 binding-protein-dependent transport systems inner membrane component [Pseudofrankia inefficax]
MAVPLQVEPTGRAFETADTKPVAGRSLWRIAWSRLRKDKVALGSAAFVVLVALVAILAPVICAILGVTPDDPDYTALNLTTAMPAGSFGGISAHHLFGVEPTNGRDVLARVVYGARVSLLVATLATLLSVVLGTVLGLVSGYVGGWLGGLIARLMDLMLAFPVLLFAIAIVAVIPDSAFGLSGGTLRLGILIFIIGFFSWPYIGRIVRGQVLSLKEKDFIAAARGTGAGPIRIMSHELLPNLVAPILVYTTLMIPTNILFEAALSYLGVGVRPPTASWGDMLSTAASGFYRVDPMYMVVPGVAIFLTVLAFNLLGDALRDAFDPRGG